MISWLIWMFDKKLGDMINDPDTTYNQVTEYVAIREATIKAKLGRIIKYIVRYEYHE